MIQAICWMLIHSLLQGLLLTLLTGIVLAYTKRSPAALRYNLLSGLFFLFLAGCALTFIGEWKHPGWGGAGLNGMAAFSENGFSSFVGTLNDYLSEQAPLIVMGWCFIFLLKCVRMTAAIVYTQKVRNYGVAEPPVYWKEKLHAFCGTLQIKKKVLLLESKLVKMPLVTGHWKPVIFIPLGLLTKLPEGEIEAVLLHELAHIRRNDVFMNFLQNIGESIFFFNPGLLWVSSLLREERENCCDDMAIDRTKNKMEFVRALIHFREYDARMAGVAVGFPAGKHQLLHRVRRIVDNKNKSLNRAERIFFIASFFIIALLLAASTRQAVRPADGRYKIVGEERTNRSQALRNRQEDGEVPPKMRAIEEAEQAEKDRAQAEKDRVQAVEDHRQATQDREQARLDKLQEEKDQEQERLDKMKADREALLTQVGREQAEIETVEATLQRKQAEKNKVQAEKDRIQVSIAIARTTETRTIVTRSGKDRMAHPR